MSKYFDENGVNLKDGCLTTACGFPVGIFRVFLRIWAIAGTSLVGGKVDCGSFDATLGYFSQ
jgi:hypothetical protein